MRANEKRVSEVSELASALRYYARQYGKCSMSTKRYARAIRKEIDKRYTAPGFFEGFDEVPGFVRYK